MQKEISEIILHLPVSVVQQINTENSKESSEKVFQRKKMYSLEKNALIKICT